MKLLFNEPHGELVGAHIIGADATEMIAEMGLAVVLVTHDLAVARLLSNRILVMKQGEVIESGLTDRVLDDPQAPYTQLLVSSVLAA